MFASFLCVNLLFPFSFQLHRLCSVWFLQGAYEKFGSGRQESANSESAHKDKVEEKENESVETVK